MFKKLKSAWDFAVKNPIKTAIIAVVATAIIIVVCLIISKYFITLLALGVLVWWACETFKTPTKAIVNLDCTANAQFMLEVMTELSGQIYIRRPFGVESLRLRNKKITPYYSFEFSAEMAENAPFDDFSLAQIKHILQGRIRERLCYGKAYGIPHTIIGNVPALVITDVFVAGNRYIYECVWVNNQAALDYLRLRNNGGNNHSQHQKPNDDLF